MDVRNCRQCGRLFNYLSGPQICQACRDALEEKFQQVKEYVRSNPGATIQMVSEDNDVTVQQIRQWIREERLEFAADSPVGIECEGCGASIRTGRFCEACKNRMRGDFNSVIEKPRLQPEPSSQKLVRDSDKMRFLKK
ncbi:MAG: flagellar protein [Lachnospiraceae bacterium]